MCLERLQHLESVEDQLREVGLMAQKQIGSSGSGSPPSASGQKRPRSGGFRDTGVVSRTHQGMGRPWLNVCKWNSHPALSPNLAVNQALPHKPRPELNERRVLSILAFTGALCTVHLAKLELNVSQVSPRHKVLGWLYFPLFLWFYLSHS